MLLCFCCDVGLNDKTSGHARVCVCVCVFVCVCVCVCEIHQVRCLLRPSMAAANATIYQTITPGKIGCVMGVCIMGVCIMGLCIMGLCIMGLCAIILSIVLGAMQCLTATTTLAWHAWALQAVGHGRLLGMAGVQPAVTSAHPQSAVHARSLVRLLVSVHMSVHMSTPRPID